jgi:hypothetical protein
MFVTEVVGQKPEAICATNLGETQILAGAQLSGSGKRECRATGPGGVACRGKGQRIVAAKDEVDKGYFHTPGRNRGERHERRIHERIERAEISLSIPVLANRIRACEHSGAKRKIPGIRAHEKE